MTNALWTPGREGFLTGEIDWDTAVIKMSPLRGYTFSAAHKFVSEILASGTGTGTFHGGAAVTLAGKTSTGGTADANDATFTALTATGAAPCALAIYQASAVGGGADVAATAQRLIGYIDTGTNIPFTPNGGDIVVAFDSGSNKIFTL
jgi:hypothetical protein